MARLRGRPEVEIALASVAAVAAFAAAAFIAAAARDHVPVAVLGACLILAVVAVAHYGGIVYALPVGVVSVQAFDWFFLPPIRPLDQATVVILGLFIVMSVLVGYVAAGAGRRAKASELARGALADEQAALRRVATLVAREAPPADVFAAVAEEVGRLLKFDAALLLTYAGDGTANVAASWAALGAPTLPVGTQIAIEGDSVAALAFRTQRPARIDDYSKAEGSTAAFFRSFGLRAAVGTPVAVEGRVWGVLTAGSLSPGPLPEGTEARIEAFTQLVATGISNAEARRELEQLAAEQAALRRVATLVAEAASPADDVFAAVAAEIAGLFGVSVAGLWRYEPDSSATLIAGAGKLAPYVGRVLRFAPDDASVLATSLRTGRPARIDDYAGVESAGAPLAGELGLGAVIGVPVVVEGRIWGVMTVGLEKGRPSLPSDTFERLKAFTELVATAISNAETRTELSASRARVVAAADETRRRLERDLHDGIQQRLVSLALELRSAATMVHRPSAELGDQLAEIAAGLTGSLGELREISRGIHPAILSEGGLEPALKALARRSTIPVRLDVNVGSRLGEPVEVAAYYVASEAFANAAKHAEASVVELQASVRDDLLVLSIRDDGVGGADPRRGSGLVGLIDRVEAVGGTISVASPPGDGTSLRVRLPLG
jgi:signal transduction histidine kinase